MKKTTIYRFFFTGLLLVLIVWGGLIITANVKAAEPVQDRIYVSVRIKTNDTLWSIAEQYCEQGSVAAYVNDLKEINGIVNDRALKPGASLMVYYYQ